MAARAPRTTKGPRGPKGQRAIDKPFLPIVTDWRIDETSGRLFGVCSVEVPPPQDYLTFKRGFPLTNPGHVRCAIFSFRLGLEIVLGDEQVPVQTSDITAAAPPVPLRMRVLKDFFCIVVTRSKLVYDFFCGDGAAKNRRWALEPSKKPATVFGYSKRFIADVFEMLDLVRGTGAGEVSCTPPEKGEEKKSVLLSHRVNLDVDPERDYEKTDDHAATEKRVDEMRQRQYLRNELMELNGARSSRARRRPTRRELRATLKKDDADATKGDTKDVADGTNPTSGAAGALGNSDSSAPGASATAAAAAACTSNPSAGCDGAAVGDACGHVQGAEHGTAGREQPAEDGAGDQ